MAEVVVVVVTAGALLVVAVCLYAVVQAGVAMVRELRRRGRGAK